MSLGDVEYFGRLLSVAIQTRQNGFDVPLLGLFKGDQHAAVICRQRKSEVFRADFIGAGQVGGETGAFHGVSQLADVPGPGIRLKRVPCTFSELLC